MIDTTDGGRIYDGLNLGELRAIPSLTTYGDLSAKGHSHSVCAWSPDTRSIVSGNERGELLRSYLFGEDHRSPFPASHAYAVTDIAFAPADGLLISVSEDATFKVWNSRDELVFSRHAHDSVVHACSFAPDGSRFATASEDRMVKLWSVEGRETAAFSHDAPVTAVSFSPEGRRIVSGSATGAIVIHDVVNRSRIAQFAPFTSRVARCWWTLDGQHIVAAYSAGAVSVVEVSTGDLRAHFAGRGALAAAALSPDASVVLVTTTTGGAFLLSLENLELNRREFLNLHARVPAG
jgi:WD40 repeat protein